MLKKLAKLTTVLVSLLLTASASAGEPETIYLGSTVKKNQTPYYFCFEAEATQRIIHKIKNDFPEKKALALLKKPWNHHYSAEEVKTLLKQKKIRITGTAAEHAKKNGIITPASELQDTEIGNMINATCSGIPDGADFIPYEIVDIVFVNGKQVTVVSFINRFTTYYTWLIGDVTGPMEDSEEAKTLKGLQDGMAEFAAWKKEQEKKKKN